MHVQEASKLAAKRSVDGSYPIVLLSAGEGSSGRYSDKLVQESAHVFEGVLSYMGHPVDPQKPHLRPIESIAGRITGVRVGEDAGSTALLGDFHPRRELESFFEQYAADIGMSIFCNADGEAMEDGRLDVSRLDESDPYRSCDVVIAAGRGGRFKRAEEAYKAYESSLGTPEGTKPGSTSAPGTHTKEGNMEEVLKALEALNVTLAPIVTFIAEQKAAAEAAVTTAEAEAKAAQQEKEAAIEAYSTAAKAVSDAGLLPSQETDILTAAKAGKDVAPMIEAAKKVLIEAKQAVDGTAGTTVVIESASAGAKQNWSF